MWYFEKEEEEEKVYLEKIRTVLDANSNTESLKIYKACFIRKIMINDDDL